MPAANMAGVQNEPKRASKSFVAAMKSPTNMKNVTPAVKLAIDDFVCEFIGLCLYVCQAVLPGTQDKSRIAGQRKRHVRRYFAGPARIG